MNDSNRRQFLNQIPKTAITLGTLSTLASLNSEAKEFSSSSFIDSTRKTQTDYLITPGVLQISYPINDYYPFFYTQKEETVGVDVDLIKRFTNSLDLKLKIDRSVKSFNDIVQLVGDRKIDAGSFITPNLLRELKVSFSQPYLSTPQSLIINRIQFAKINKGDRLENTIQNFYGSIGVSKGSVWENLASQNFPKANIVRFESWKMCVEAVIKGKVTCSYNNEFFVKQVLKKDPSLALILRIVSFNDLFDNLSYAVHHDNRILVELFNIFVSQRSGQLKPEELYKLI